MIPASRGMARFGRRWTFLLFALIGACAFLLAAQALANPGLVLAIASGAIAFVVMSFVMTATPISMHLHHGHSLEDTKWVIQSHIAAMFLHSLFTALLFWHRKPL